MIGGSGRRHLGAYLGASDGEGRYGGETEGFGYQYPLSTQPHRVAACRWVSSCIRSLGFELAKNEPGLCAALGPHQHIVYRTQLAYIILYDVLQLQTASCGPHFAV